MQWLVRLVVAVFALFALNSLALAEEHKKGDHKKGESSTTTSAPAARPPQPVAPPATNRHPSGNSGNAGNHPGNVRDPHNRDGERTKGKPDHSNGFLGLGKVLHDQNKGRGNPDEVQGRHTGRGHHERRHVRGSEFYITYLDGLYYEERYQNYGENDHALFPVQYDDAPISFGGVLDGNKRIGPHFQTLAINPVLRNFFWPYPYAPQAGIHTYWLPRKRVLTTCDDGRSCYDYWSWKKATISINESDVEAVYDDQSDEDGSLGDEGYRSR